MVEAKAFHQQVMRRLLQFGELQPVVRDLVDVGAGGDVSAGAGADSGGTPAEETRTGGETTEPGRVTETFRLVTVGDGDDPASVLAGTDGGAGAVYTLDLFSVEDLTIEGYTQEEMDLLDWSPMPGALEIGRASCRERV